MAGSAVVLITLCARRYYNMAGSAVVLITLCARRYYNMAGSAVALVIFILVRLSFPKGLFIHVTADYFHCWIFYVEWLMRNLNIIFPSGSL